MKPRLPNQLYRRQFVALISFGILILLLDLGFNFYKSNQQQVPLKIEFKSDDVTTTSATKPLVLAEFNPNDLDAAQWQKLGFTERQAATILKYKNVIGGQFLSKEQFKKCYPIRDRYDELEPYILLPETNYEAKSGNFNYKKFEKKELKIPGKFNPDLLSAKDWQNMGFSENQANAILKYKSYLGGSFVSKEKFKECFIISEENYRKLAPYLILPEKTPKNFRNYAKNSYPEKAKIQYRPFDPNLLDLEGWKSLGFSEKQANVIVNYREKNLRGSFKSLEDIKNCFVINDDKFEEMKPFIRLNPENFKTNSALVYANQTPKNEVAASPEVKTDFSKVDLNQITFKQMREFGFTEKDAAIMLSFRKKLGGFVNKNQISEVWEIDKDLATKLASSTQLNSGNVAKYTLVDAPEDWLKNHPYFKFSADKIIFYRISNPDDKKIWKFLKLKPEYEAKMRLYTK